MPLSPLTATQSATLGILFARLAGNLVSRTEVIRSDGWPACLAYNLVGHLWLGHFIRAEAG